MKLVILVNVALINNNAFKTYRKRCNDSNKITKAYQYEMILAYWIFNVLIALELLNSQSIIFYLDHCGLLNFLLLLYLSFLLLNFSCLINS